MAVDILFDVFLVQEYFYMDQECLTVQWKSCHSTKNETSFDPSCAPNTTELIESQDIHIDTLNIFCIPLKLDVKPRFMFSLGFIMWPMVCYRVIQVTVFFNFFLTGTKKLKNGKPQPFLFRIYVDILIF